MRLLLCSFFASLAVGVAGCTAGVAHAVTVVLPTPHLTPAGKARQFGTLYFFTDRNMPETSTAFSALLSGQTAQALDALGKIEGANLPAIQRAYWQNDVAVCFILEGRYKEADELLLQAGLTADEDVIRHNHRVSVYLNDSHTLHKTRQRPVIVPEGTAAQATTTPAVENKPDVKKTDDKGVPKP
ncbi:MAG: hypothetical protein OHK0011_01600 [Turneriella sp.]